MTCIKMGSDDSHFNVSLIVRDSHKTVHKPQLLKRKESRSGIEPMSFRLPAYALPLGQTGSIPRLPNIPHTCVVCMNTL